MEEILKIYHRDLAEKSKQLYKELLEKEIMPEIEQENDEAFEMMVPYITLDPTYVYDKSTGKYILCGLLDAAEAVDAVTGEIVTLSDL